MRAMSFGAVLIGVMTVVFGACSRGGAQGEPVDEGNEREVSKVEYDNWMADLSNWGRWGEEDQLGALNLITPAKRVAAARLVETGKTVSMAREMTIKRLPDETLANRAPVLAGEVNNVFGIDHDNGYFWERYEIEYHGGEITHLDAFCHVSYNGKVYNGLNFADVTSLEDGCTQMGSVNLKDGLVTRGVLVDLPGRAVRPQDIKTWEAQTGITIGPGDALFLRTGRDVGQVGGYHPLLIPFFKERDIALLGADVAQEGGEVEDVAIPVHFFTLVALGVHLFDNLGLEELAQTASELNRWEFMFMASPHVVPNGAGTAINPIAVF